LGDGRKEDHEVEQMRVLKLNLEYRFSVIYQWFYSPLLGPGLFFSFVIFFTQSVGLLGRVFSPSQGRYLYTGQHKHTINAYTDIRALSGIRTHDSNVRATEDSSQHRPRGHRDQQNIAFKNAKFCEVA
jgi:hypothetical protein